MGALCSRRSTADCSPNRNISHVNGQINHGSVMVHQSGGVILDRNLAGEPFEKRAPEPLSFTEPSAYDSNDGISQLSRRLSHKSRSTKANQAAVTKASEVSSLFGRVGTAGLGKAVEVLDTLGSGMTDLQIGSGFVSGVNTKGNRISILAFEVANTIVEGANLMQALSDESIKHLKEVVFPSEGVVRFGNRCKDPQWHNLDRYFDELGSELAHQKQRKEEAENMMQQLISVQYTAALYHELNAVDGFEQDYRRKLQEEDNPNAVQRGNCASNMVLSYFDSSNFLLY